MKVPDGKIDVHGVTWKRLAGAQGPVSASPALPQAPSYSQVLSLAAGKGLTDSVPVPDKNTVNQKLAQASPGFMIAKLGQPRHSYTDDCLPPTHEALKRRMVTRSVGPFRVTGLNSAVDSLQTVLEQVQRDQPAVYKALGYDGMLCCRSIRGANAPSNHSWGTAIDLKINGKADTWRDGKTLVGLLLIVPIFNQYGWYWGGAFSREDSMHFEASQALITQWALRTSGPNPGTSRPNPFSKDSETSRLREALSKLPIA
jgi:hypothetical protein